MKWSDYRTYIIRTIALSRFTDEDNIALVAESQIWSFIEVVVHDEVFHPIDTISRFSSK